ncbi:MAG: hypothetical protein LBE56_02400 [Tannerella sp.]|jgi:hypothetical protein|nr:hypothetical protein [Tannerella sp.]
MYCPLYHQVKRFLPSRKRAGRRDPLYADTMKFVHLMQQILLMSFYLLTKAIIFVRLLPDQKSSVPVDMPFDGRKPAAAQYKRHRLLQFTRAVFMTCSG